MQERRPKFVDYFENDTYLAYVKRNRKKKAFRRFARIMACIVAFVTTYALILPAITMEKESFCGLEEHTHTEACYSLQIQNKILICDGSNIGIHVHNGSCRNADGIVVCGQADYVVHSHDDSCRNSDGILVCVLEELAQHMHTNACYDTPVPVPHVHNDDCKVAVKGDLICGLEIKEGHKHSNACYQVGSELECTKPVGHQHSDGCYVYPLICTLSAQPHAHDAGCYQKKMVCTVSEEHDHDDSCYQEYMTCGKTEGEVHTHEAGCYSEESQLKCGLDENHMHNDSCYKKKLTCETPESEGHSHVDECYHWDTEYGCGMEEGEPEAVKPTLICTEPKAPVHIHGDGCFETKTGDAEPGCGIDHDHSYSCYVCSCTLQAHTHDLACYSDPEADVESRETWEATMNEVELTGNWNTDVVAIAESQLGYVESTRNYAVWEDKSIHGYTRYGAWYGVPYGDWCGMFASFCLHYAGVEGMPYNYGVRPWIEELSEPELDLYRIAEEYCPIPGDLVFFDWEDDGLSDHVGIVFEVIAATETENAKLKTIEGNSSNCVRYVTYDLDDPVLLGYSMLPEKPEEGVPVYYCGMEVHSHGEDCYDEEGGLVCEQDEHTHGETCLTEKIETPEYHCGMEDHVHEEVCYDKDGNLICKRAEHQHEESCLTEQTEEQEYFCGVEEHTHGDECYDEEDNLTCELDEHTHTSLCMTDLNDLDVAVREKVETVIRLIDEIPSADEIDAKILEFEEAEDYEGEELWLTEVYQNVGLAYSNYVGLTEELQARVINREKLLELEYIWSMMPLATYYVWLDGTNGGQMSLSGSDNTRYTLTTAGWNPYEFTLPETWESPSKYHYTLRGWYDIYSRQYYSPGDKVTIDQNTVFYADWKAASYNIGQFDAHVVDTVSTNDFVTTRMFDYSGIFNMLSSEMTEGSISSREHSERWNAVTKGRSLSNNTQSLGIILRDWDSGGPYQNSWPANWNDDSQTQNTSQDTVTFGLYDAYNMYNLFFNPNSNYMGKEYLGTADHLFQYEKNPASPYYGYYFYDSARNAASYNQSTGRFYVYDYLERTTTSQDNGKESDFLPFNSPYANLTEEHGPTISTAASGQTLYTFDSGDGNSRMAGTNFWFGMTTDIRFYLPSVPGTKDKDGHYSNQSIYGKEMEFRFSGDDDVFVLVDNQLVLDIGGMHDIKSGTINFSRGTVTVEGAEQTAKTALIQSLEPGEHTLTLLYMERGSSMSNCSIYFNISPRFTLSLQKEDLMSNALLNGAEFQVFMDEGCTVPATLWPSYQAYQQSAANTTNTLTVVKGKSTIWGFAAGNTYYIKETKPPDKLPNGQEYLLPNGLIRMELSNKGVASYTVIVIPDPNAPPGEENPSPGFTVEGFRIDEETHVAYLIITNSLQQGETTEVLVRKVWEGTETTPVTVYLLADGKRIREVTLRNENGWQHIWENLPKFQTDGTTEIQYTVEEGTVTGYVGTVESITQSTVTTAAWEQTGSFAGNETFLLQTPAGCLATDETGKLHWVSIETAKVSASAQWTVEYLNGTTLRLKNEAGYYLRSNWLGWGDGEAYFYTAKQEGTVRFENARFREDTNEARYMLTQIDSSGHAQSSYNNEHTHVARFTLHQKTQEESGEELNGLGFRITNRPISAENQTELTVTKRWTQRDGETPFVDTSFYQESNVPVKLLINGADSGRSGSLNLRNGWKYTFSGLPKKDAQGNDIMYSVAEDWDSEYWEPKYGNVISNGDGTYTTEINNVYSYLVEIPVEKTWDDFIHDGDRTPVTFVLYSAADDNMTGTLMGTVTVSADTQWKGVFRTVPPEEAKVKYYIYETTDRFMPGYGEPTSIFIDGVSRTVSRVTFDAETGMAANTVVMNHPMVELPKTGASGTGRFTAGGLLLTAAAVILLCYKRRKEWSNTS